MNEGKGFRKLGTWTIVAVYILILVGGIVRATGSGMGCPDWPKCFGSWIPPTTVEQLPINYEEIFGAKLKGEVVFNPLKTWIEYINRLVGVLIGFLIFATFVSSFLTYWKKNKAIVVLSFIAFLLVAFEGWLGSKVVATELHPGMITLHMLLSIIIVFVLIFVVRKAYFISNNAESNELHIPIDSRAINFLLVVMMILTTGQVLLGTQVREAVDAYVFSNGRNFEGNWISELGGKYYLHIILGVIVSVAHIFYFKKIKESNVRSQVFEFTKLLILVVGIEIFSGILLSYFKMLAIAQPVHLFLAVVALGLQFVMYLMVNENKVFELQIRSNN